MEKKENKIVKTAKKALSFVKEHKKAFIIGGSSTLVIGSLALGYGYLKHEESVADGLAAELDPEGENGIDSIFKDNSSVSMLISNIEANQIGDRVAMMYGNHGVDEHTPISAMIEFDISNVN